MTTSGYIFQAVLVLIVLRQIPESEVDLMSFLLPVALVTWAGFQFLHSIPSAGNDLVLIGGMVTFGALLGLASGAATHVRADGSGRALQRAGAWAVGLWVFGMGFRIVFAYAADHGLGDELARFSMTHAITSADAWTAAFVLMAFAQVLVRTAVIRVRAFRLTGSFGLLQPAAA